MIPRESISRALLPFLQVVLIQQLDIVRWSVGSFKDEIAELLLQLDESAVCYILGSRASDKRGGHRAPNSDGAFELRQVFLAPATH